MRSIVYIVMLFCLSISAIFCGCAEDASNGGKNEPMSFSAEICNRTQTRAAVDTSKHSGTNLIVHTAEPAKGITLSVSKMTRTSTADGYWPSGANLAVQQGGTVKQYTVDGSGNITSSSPFYWANKNDVSVTSWFPYSASLPTTWSVNSDQSTESNYNGSDLLYSSGTLSYDGNKTLKYNHQTAKIVINVTRPGYASDPSNIESITIGTSDTPIDLSGTVGGDGSITATSTTTGYITPYSTTPLSSDYSATYIALVIPQDMQNKKMIAIKVYNTTYYYKPTTSTSLLAGHEYDYNITIPIEYYFSDGSWGTLADHATASVHPIGVVFSKKTSAIDQAHGWTHGYAMALTNAVTNYSTKTCIWAGTSYQSTDEAGASFDGFKYINYNSNNGNGDYTSFIADKDGYSETHAIANEYPSTLEAYLPPFYYALNFGTNVENTTTSYAAPNESSGWYLPSVGQWWDILINLGGMQTAITNSSTGWLRWYGGDISGNNNNYSSICANNINNYLTAISSYGINNGYNYGTSDLFSNSVMSYGDGSNTYSLGEYYWSASEYNCYSAYNTGFDKNGNLDLDNSNKNTLFRIRCLLAF
jgi:hypothetical protein